MDIFNEDAWSSKTVIPGLWENVRKLVESGVIVSHVEVLDEINTDGEKGEELYNWAHANKHVFHAHDLPSEGDVIRAMSTSYKSFVNRRVGETYADPWLIAQAKVCKLKIITEETFTNSPNPEKFNIPNICRDPAFDVKCLNLLELTKERGWKFGSS